MLLCLPLPNNPQPLLLLLLLCCVQVGGGIPKMRHYFGLQGWPATSVLGGREPASEEEKTQVVEVLQAWKTEKYKEIIGGCCWEGGAHACWLCLLACWLAGSLACWLAGLLACWLAGLLACWLAGLLACWLAWCSGVSTVRLREAGVWGWRLPTGARHWQRWLQAARSLQAARPFVNPGPAPLAPCCPHLRRQRRGGGAARHPAPDGRGAGGGGARGGVLRGHQGRGGVCAGQPAGQGEVCGAGPVHGGGRRQGEEAQPAHLPGGVGGLGRSALG